MAPKSSVAQQAQLREKPTLHGRTQNLKLDLVKNRALKDFKVILLEFFESYYKLVNIFQPLKIKITAMKAIDYNNFIEI